MALKEWPWTGGLTDDLGVPGKVIKRQIDCQGIETVRDYAFPLSHAEQPRAPLVRHDYEELNTSQVF